MDLRELQQHWTRFGETDPLWSILTDADKQNGGWQLGDFFRSGEEEIAHIIDYIESLHIPLRRAAALDFGCGVGRLTQALCHHFDRCYGVDIARPMIEFAERYNRHDARCRYLLNTAPDLLVFQDNTFDLIYTTRVLQHMQPKYAKAYVAEFVRTLAPTGLAIFQIPGGRVPLQQEPSDGCGIATAPLPSGAMQARLDFVNPPAALAAGELSTIHVVIQNRSDVLWPALGLNDYLYQIKLGNHWLDAAGTLILRDDGRATLPRDLHPSEHMELTLVVTAPKVPGTYTLEVDMVQEGVAWFGDQSSETGKLLVEVRAAAETTGLTDPPHHDSVNDTPVMQMYCVPQQEIVETVEASGGTVLDVQEDGLAGEGWLSYRYCVGR